MSVLGSIITESVVQVSDSFRIDCTKSAAAKDDVAGITLVEIQPEASDAFIDVTGSSYRDWFLDWQYDTPGSKTVTLRITADAISTFTFDVECISFADDKLPCTDQDLFLREPELSGYMRPGKTSFRNRIRRSRDEILDWFDRRGYFDSDGNRLTKDSFIDDQELKEWCIFRTLFVLFRDFSNNPEDQFADKAKSYKGELLDVMTRVRTRFDFNNDGTQTNSENIRTSSSRLIRD